MDEDDMDDFFMSMGTSSQKSVHNTALQNTILQFSFACMGTNSQKPG
jgi:hypothetical protein